MLIYFLHSCFKIQARREKDPTSEMRLNSAKNVRLKKRDESFSLSVLTTARNCKVLALLIILHLLLSLQFSTVMKSILSQNGITTNVVGKSFSSSAKCELRAFYCSQAQAILHFCIYSFKYGANSYNTLENCTQHWKIGVVMRFFFNLI